MLVAARPNYGARSTVWQALFLLATDKGATDKGTSDRQRQTKGRTFCDPAEEDAAKSAGVSDRKPNTKPAHALPEYAADYEHPGYGRIRIGFENDHLTLCHNKFTTPLEHWHYEIFKAPADRQNDLELTRVQFHTDLGGDIASLTIAIEPNVDPISFTRQPPAEMRERKSLDTLAGEYGGTAPIHIVVRDDNVLQYSVLGNARELIPVRGTYFRMKDFASTAVEFLRNPEGQADRMAIYSAGSENVIAPRKK